jgi:hypothetical protein
MRKNFTAGVIPAKIMRWAAGRFGNHHAVRVAMIG